LKKNLNIMRLPVSDAVFSITANGSRLGEVAEHKTSLVLQMLKIKIKCQTKNKTAILPNRWCAMVL